jgi:hypothetical protein
MSKNFILFASSLLYASFINPIFAISGHEIKKASSLFAIITQKEGVASGLAHDHLIVASQYNAELNLDGENISGGKFEIKIPTSGLLVDSPEEQKRWTPRIQELGLRKEDFSPLGETDRKKITGNMLDKNQLSATEFPNILGKIISLKKADGNLFSLDKKISISANYLAEMSFEIKGKSVIKLVPANVSLKGTEVHVTAVVPLLFTEFGIKPYSALLGAIRNSNNFTVVVDFFAEKK